VRSVIGQSLGVYQPLIKGRGFSAADASVPLADEDFASEAEKMFLDDFALSREVQPGDYSDRSFWFKLAVRLSRLTAPVL